jgi:hypothetical protein
MFLMYSLYTFQQLPIPVLNAELTHVLDILMIEYDVRNDSYVGLQK